MMATAAEVRRRTRDGTITATSTSGLAPGRVDLFLSSLHLAVLVRTSVFLNFEGLAQQFETVLPCIRPCFQRKGCVKLSLEKRRRKSKPRHKLNKFIIAPLREFLSDYSHVMC